MAVILGALVAAAVLPVLIQKIVDAPAGLLKDRPERLLRKPGQGRGQQHVLGAPYRPIVHGTGPVPHPPEMLRQIRRKDPLLEPFLDQGGDERADLIQLLLHHIPGRCQDGAGLCGKQIQDRTAHVREGELGRIPQIGVVGRQLPGRLPADQPQPVDDLVQIPPLMLGAFRQDQGIEPGAPGKLLGLKLLPVPGPRKFQKIRGQDLGPAFP